MVLTTWQLKAADARETSEEGLINSSINPNSMITSRSSRRTARISNRLHSLVSTSLHAHTHDIQHVGDPATGLMPRYWPPGQWNEGPKCRTKKYFLAHQIQKLRPELR
ncbi:hypothetical protein PM082_010562 [Marasmius tenuissimus]|nr:hypothetical protein PM082_010562 [Marasmius tenuissimus]